MRPIRCALAVLVLAASLMAGGAMERRATRIVVGAIDVEDASPKDVFQLLQDQAKKADPEGQGINMLFRFSPAGLKAFTGNAITMKMNNVPFSELVRYVCLASGLRYSYDDHALMVFDSTAPQSMDTRVYHLKAGVLDSTRTRHKAKRIEGMDDDDDD